MMVLETPRYLAVANIQDDQIRYRWDDWNVEQAEEPVDDDFLRRLQGVSQRAIVAFTNGTAEWIIFRLKVFTDTTLPLQYLEAAWAQIVDFRYAAFTWEERVGKGEWIGPVRGPIGTAMLRVMYAIQQAKENAFPELRAAWISNLASYVMPAADPYRQWQEEVMRRLELWYPRDPKETLGDAVPRAAVDPASGFLPQQTESVINSFLATLDYTRNPFLNSPTRMLELGFGGIPYVFDIRADRERRSLL